jgi:hypothetical protein
MSIDAEVVMLFRAPVTLVQAVKITLRAGIDTPVEVENADLKCWISSSGQLDYVEPERSGPLLGEQPLQGRLWHAYLGGRFWTKSTPNYGADPKRYGKAIAVLLDDSDIENVWYGTGLLRDGSALHEPVELAVFQD